MSTARPRGSPTPDLLSYMLARTYIRLFCDKPKPNFSLVHVRGRIQQIVCSSSNWIAKSLGYLNFHYFERSEPDAFFDHFRQLKKLGDGTSICDVCWSPRSRATTRWLRLSGICRFAPKHQVAYCARDVRRGEMANPRGWAQLNQLDRKNLRKFAKKMFSMSFDEYPRAESTAPSFVRSAIV